MAEDILTVEERYAEAAVDSRDMDTLAAAGMAGQEHREATRLWRLIDSMDANEYKDALAGLIDALLAHDNRMWFRDKKRDRLTQTGAKKCAELFVGYLIAPICPSCLGRGAGLISGNHDNGGRGVLGASCSQCGGTGKRSLRKEASSLGEQAVDYVMWLNGEVLSQSIIASRTVARKRFYREID